MTALLKIERSAAVLQTLVQRLVTRGLAMNVTRGKEKWDITKQASHKEDSSQLLDRNLSDDVNPPNRKTATKRRTLSNSTAVDLNGYNP